MFFFRRSSDLKAAMSLEPEIATANTFSRSASLLSATATALEVEPVIRTILLSVMKPCCACTAWFSLAARKISSSPDSIRAAAPAVERIYAMFPRLQA